MRSVFAIDVRGLSKQHQSKAMRAASKNGRPKATASSVSKAREKHIAKDCVVDFSKPYRRA